MYIGAHIKKDGTIHNTIKSIIKSGGNALQLFISNPRSCQIANIENFESQNISRICKENDFKLIIHAPYVINLAKDMKEDKRTIEMNDCYWIKTVINQLSISDIIGSIGVVIHVGKSTTNSKENALKNMYEAIIFIIRSKILLGIKSKLILETPAGQGTELLADVKEFVNFINVFTYEERKHIGVCLDTAHIWSSGYDINDYLDIIIKNQIEIDVIHFNNSKKEKSSKVDVHDTIFEGKIPVEDMILFIKNLKQNSKKLPLIILEKPSEKNMEHEFESIQKHLLDVKLTRSK